MKRAAKFFFGTHDFSAFANGRGKENDSDPRRTIVRSELFFAKDQIEYVVHGDGFLYRMVRRMMGALVDVARRKITPEEIVARLRNPKDFIGHTLTVAPANGLVLDRVFYAPPFGEIVDQLYSK
jgi:tRNA pseudouridine38-40 synthase